MFRKSVVLVFLVAMLALLPAMAFAAGNNVAFIIGLNKYFVNDQLPGVNMDVAPFIQDGRTFVPVRYLANALGVTDDNIKWDSVAKQVYLKLNNTTVTLVIGQASIITNGQTKAIDVAPVIQNDRTFLPARYVAEALVNTVDWDSVNKIVTCYPQNAVKPDVSNVIAQAQQKPIVIGGFNIPAGTHLDLHDAASPDPADSSYALIDFEIDGSRGDVPGQVADAQNILSQSKSLDPATVDKAVAAINRLIPGQPPMHNSAFNSLNGGSVSVVGTPLIRGYCWVDVQIYAVHLPAARITAD